MPNLRLPREWARIEPIISMLGFLVAMTLLVAMVVLAWRSLEDYASRSDALEAAYSQRVRIDAVRTRYERMRSDWRHYLLTGASQWLSDYRDSASALAAEVAALRGPAEPDAGRHPEMDRLERAVLEDRRIRDALAARRNPGTPADQAYVVGALEKGNDAGKVVSAQFARLIGEENAGIEARKRQFETGERRFRWIVLGGSAIAVALFAAAFAVLRGEIGRRRRSQAEAERLAAELDDLYNNAPCGYHSVDETGFIVRMNDTWLRWLGYSRDEVVGKKNHAELMTPQSARRFREEMFPLFRKQGWLKEVEFEYVRKDGTTFPGSLQTSTVYDDGGRYLYSRTTVFDISARKRVEDELKESHAFLDSIVENIPNMIFVKDAADLRFVRFNRAGEELLGFPREQLIGKGDYDFFPRAEADQFTAKDREVLAAGKLVDIEAEEIATRTKGVRILHTRKLPVFDTAGRPRYLLGISEDITEKRRAQEAIRALNADLATRARQLEDMNKELESFSYSVSHDLRAPLRAVDGFARMLEEDYAERLDAEGRRLLGVVRASSRQMGQLIDDLLAFSRLGRQAIARGRVDMRRLVDEVIAEMRARFPTTKIEIGPLPHAEGDGALLRQVWINLIGNALKYSAKAPEPTVSIRGEARDGENVYRVQDNGAGFDMRYRDKLFGVFQRLHRADEFEGTGVGLAIVQRIVARHGGRVDAEAKLGQGATFSFALPARAAT